MCPDYRDLMWDCSMLQHGYSSPTTCAEAHVQNSVLVINESIFMPVLVYCTSAGACIVNTVPCSHLTE